MIERKNTGVILLVILLILFVYCISGLIKETRSRAQIMESDDIYMFSAGEGMKIDESLDEGDSEACLISADGLIKKFDPYTKGLENVTIHHRLDLRRGLASKNRIWIRCLRDIQEFENIFLHELGHIVAQNYISDELEKSYYNIGGDTVSGYGSEKPEEDFAEAFLMYISYGQEFRHIMQDNKTLERKYVFFRDIVFDSHEFGKSNALKEEVIERYENDLYLPYDVSVLHKS